MVVAVLPGPARREHAWAPIEFFHRETRVVGNGHQSGVLCPGASLDEGVIGEGAAVLNGFVVVGDVGKREDFYAAIGKYGAQFVGFFGVIGGEENFHYAYFPNEASWASMSSLQPFSA